MNKIITISREFGSGGREVGKRLADALGYAYYDKEIIEMLAHETGMDEEYLSKLTEKGVTSFPLEFRRSFYTMNTLQANQSKILVLENKIIKKLAEKGSCVIVGRGADIILREYHPFKIFTYASLEAKVNRCVLRASEEENLTIEEMVKKMKLIDKNRKSYYELLSNNKWGNKENYDLCLNTTNIEVKAIIKPLTNYINTYFAGGNNEN